MARLPNPGGDPGNWGDILNDYLSQVHTASGQLKYDSVGTAQLKDNAVGSTQLQANAVTASTLAPGSVTSASLASNAVNTASIAPGAITTATIATDAVTATSIADGTITNNQLADDTVTEPKLAPAVRTKLNAPASITDGAVSTAKLADGAVTTAKLQDNAITSAKIADGAIQATDIADSTLTGTKLADTTIPKAKLSTAVQSTLDKADSALQSAPVTSVNTKTGAVTLTKGDIGLGSVDNTADTNKPVSTAVQTALDAKVNTGVSAVNNQLVVFSDTTGNNIKAAGISTGSIVTASSTHTFTNKTIDASSGGNVISNISLTSAVSGILPIANGGTGSSTQNFVDLTTSQTAAGYKTFSGGIGVANQLYRSGADIVGVAARTSAITLTTSSPMVNYADATSAAFTVTLPATTTSGLIFVVKKIDTSANAVTVAGTSIDGAASVALAKNNDFVQVVSTSTSGTWKIIGGNTAAANSGLVDVASNQTISGAKSFTAGITAGGTTTLGGLQFTTGARTSTTALTTGSAALNLCDATSAAFSVTLPATTIAGYVYILKKTDSSSNAVTITAGTAIDNLGTSVVLTKQNDNITVVSTVTSGTWKVISGNVGVATTDPVTASITWTGAVTLSDVTPGTRKISMTGNTTLTVPNGPSGQSYSIMLDLVQDATGSRTLTCSGVKWAYGVAPTLSTAANARDIITLWWSGSDWVGFVGAQAVA